ncbi:uracil-DNA glycosylase-like protein [Entophlyctis helioformis]|nr:uracil-DNA glycosylase-like protein [Entophlyctis helioformis]
MNASITDFFKPKDGGSVTPAKTRTTPAGSGRSVPSSGASTPSAKHSLDGTLPAAMSPKRRRVSVDGNDEAEAAEAAEAAAAAAAEDKGTGSAQVAKSSNPLLQTEALYMADDWYKAFAGELHKPYFLEIKRALQRDWDAGVRVYPAPADMYSFTRTPLASVKVVILGQDPYHQPGQAHGLAFSVQKGVSVPPSLRNIYAELESDIAGFKRPAHGTLSAWGSQGVLLLNATLTVVHGTPNSHAQTGWQTFTTAVISYIAAHNPHVVFLLWGAAAQKKVTAVMGSSGSNSGSGNGKNGKNGSANARHLVLRATHPSPLGANKGGWFGCRHFSKANAWLVDMGLEPVDWTAICRD